MSNQANMYFAEYRGKRMSEENEKKIFNEILNIYSVMRDTTDYKTMRLMFYYLYNLAILEGVRSGEDFFDFMYEKSIDFTFHNEKYMELSEKYEDGYSFISRAGMMLSSESLGGPKFWFCCFFPDYEDKEKIIKIFNEELFNN